jgi:hypothetical protein
MKHINLIGQKFNKLTISKIIEKPIHIKSKYSIYLLKYLSSNIFIENYITKYNNSLSLIFPLQKKIKL